MPTYKDIYIMANGNAGLCNISGRTVEFKNRVGLIKAYILRLYKALV